MKKTYLFLCLVALLGLSGKAFAQTDPGTANLTHQWTFDDGTPTDVVGGVNGVLMDGATVQNSALDTKNGGYLQLDGAALALNQYEELTVEVWFTSVRGANTSYHMLTYFGGTDGNNGTNYFCMNPGRGGNDNHSRAILHTADADDWVEGPEFDDGQLHHLVGVVSATTINLYVDGSPMLEKALSATNFLANLETTLAYLGKGGYRADPIWKGSMHKVSIYNKALNSDEIFYLYSHGPEQNSVLTVSTASMVLDNNYTTEDIYVSSANLINDITITAPTGITIEPTPVTKNVANVRLSVSYTGNAPVDGVITISSGSLTQEIRVKAVPGTDCFVPLFEDQENKITDPGMVSLSNYAGWGTKTVSNILTDPDNVYCGASTIKIGNGIDAGSGSLDFPLNDLLLPNTVYIVKVMAKSTGTFRLATERADINGLKQTLFDTNGEWKPVILVFKTGEVLEANPVLYINDWNLNGTQTYVDNYEMYVMPDGEGYIDLNKSSLGFDPEATTDNFQLSGYNLTNDFVITAPAGITIEATNLAYDAVNADVFVTFDGTTPVNGNITVTSGTMSKTIAVKAITTSNATCFTPTANKTNKIPDPYFNDQANFRGWGSWSIISIPDTGVYCGSHAAKISGRGDIEVPLVDLQPNYTYKSKVMLLTHGKFHMGINGHDTMFSGDFTDSINTNGVWQEYTFEFHTGDTLRTDPSPVIFFNNDGDGPTADKLAYLDNWELIEVGPTAAPVVKDMFNNVYFKNGKITAEFELDQAANVQLSVYNIQGALISTEKMAAVAGRNSKVINSVLPSGVYVVKMSYNGKSSFRKLVK